LEDYGNGLTEVSSPVFNSPVTITANFIGADLTPFDTSTLKIIRYSGGQWRDDLSSCNVDLQNQKISCLSSGFSDFVVTASGSGNLVTNKTVKSGNISSTNLYANWSGFDGNSAYIYYSSRPK
jgi:hypothetical protein